MTGTHSNGCNILEFVTTGCGILEFVAAGCGILEFVAAGCGIPSQLKLIFDKVSQSFVKKRDFHQYLSKFTINDGN